jgi:hypothetical protein
MSLTARYRYFIFSHTAYDFRDTGGLMFGLLIFQHKVIPLRFETEG